VDVEPVGLQTPKLLTAGRSDPLPLDGHLRPLPSADRLVGSRGSCLHLHRHGLPAVVHCSKHKIISHTPHEIIVPFISSSKRSFVFPVTWRLYHFSLSHDIAPKGEIT
jgi:hypothetical protein